MLSADQLDSLTVPIIDLYEKYMTSVIEDIARRLSKMDMTSTAAWQMQRLIESGKVYENAITEITKLTGQSEAVLRETFEKAGVTSIRFDDAIYKEAGLTPLPLNQSPAMVDVMKAGLTKTGGVMQNLTLTTAIDAQILFLKSVDDVYANVNKFIGSADLAYMQVSTGAMNYKQAITSAVRNVGDAGLYVHYPGGHRDRLDVAMRRTVLTGVSQTTSELQLARAQEMGQDLVQTSAHFSARPSHAEWQGKIFSRSGADSQYPDFVESTKYGTGGGLGGYNCRHSFYQFFKGISENAYNQQDSELLKETAVTYNDKVMTVYEATQEQRRIERTIRQYKRRKAAHLASVPPQTEAANSANTLIRKWQARARDLVKQTGLKRDYFREQV